MNLYFDTEECINMRLQVSIDENESMSNHFCRMGLSPKIWTRTNSLFKMMESELIFTCIDTEECIDMRLQVSIDENESMSNQFCRMGLSPKIWTRTNSLFKVMESDHISHADFPSHNLRDELKCCVTIRTNAKVLSDN